METKDTLIEIKNNLQGNNRRVHEAENQINGLEHKEEKIASQNNKKKKASKKYQEYYKQLLGQLQEVQRSLHRGARRRRERPRNWKSI